MPEEALETQELKERLEELEEGGEASSNRWTLWLSLSTALLAVLAAVASLKSGACANDAILEKNDAVLHQSKADDAWAHYQAMSVKAVVYATQAEATPSADLSRKWRGEAEREKNEQKDVKLEAEREEAAVEHNDAGAEHALHLHHQFAKSVTIFQIAIALAAIAALVRRKPMWWLSLAIGAAGTVFFALGFIHA
jgi:hypothetical protein